MDVLKSPAAPAADPARRVLPMESHHLGQRIDVEGCARAFVDRVQEVAKSDVCLRLGAGRVYLFAFGAAVFVDVERAQIDVFLKEIEPHLKGRSEQANDDFLVEILPEGRERVAFDRVYCSDASAQKLKLAALVLAQSTTLESFEKRVDRLLDQAATMTDSMASGGRVQLNSKEMIRFIGVGLSTRREIVSRLSLLDSPDVVWEDPALDVLFNELRANFELQTRFRTLETKLRLVHESVEVLVELSNTRRFTILEVIIIALIAAEILMAALGWR
ncbi:MAG: RMD1 family protein [Candidatus Eremiobacterota bacterium]